MSDGPAGLPKHDGPRASRDRGAASLGIEIDDFDLPPFSQQGGWGAYTSCSGRSCRR